MMVELRRNMQWNRWSVWSGMAGQFAPESVDSLLRNTHLLFRDLEQPLAPPHADDPDSARIDTVDHSKRRHDDFP
jgi:hypothetical protein